MTDPAETLHAGVDLALEKNVVVVVSERANRKVSARRSIGFSVGRFRTRCGVHHLDAHGDTEGCSGSPSA